MRAIARGETLIERLTCTDRETGARVSLDGCELVASIAPEAGAEPTIVLTVGKGITLADQSAPTSMGQALLVWPSSQTADLRAEVYFLDVWVIDAAGTEQPVIEPTAIRVYTPVRRRTA